MIYVGIDIAKDKHDCFVLSSEGKVMADVFTIPNNAEVFDTLLQSILRCARPDGKIKVGLEATEHYSYNILGFLLDKGLTTYVINPLHTNLYRKCLSLRKTKTDRVDARTIATMLMSDVDLKSYTDTYVCLWDPTFAAYLAKKRTEGKHYNVAISHAAQKLVRLIYAMEKSRQPYYSAV